MWMCSITAGNNFRKSYHFIFQQIIDYLLLYYLQTLCFLLLLINILSLSSLSSSSSSSSSSSPSVFNIGLIYANTTIPKAPDFLQAGFNDVTVAQSLHDYQFRLLSVPSTGCFHTKYEGNDPAVIAEMYYENDLQMLLGPACDSDVNIVRRLTEEWNILQFSFGGYLDDYFDSVVQISTLSSLNAAFNLVAFFKIMSWNKVALIWSVIAFDDEYTTKLKIANIRTIFELNGISLLKDIHVNTSDATRPLVDVLMEIKNNSRIWIPIFGYYLHDYIEFLAAVKQLSLDPTVYVTVLLDFFVLGEFKPPWILPNNSINETMKFYFDDTIIARPFGPIWLNQYRIRLTPFQAKYVEVFKEEPVSIAKLFLTEECNLPKKERANKRCITLTGEITNYNTTITMEFPVDVPPCGFQSELCDHPRTLLSFSVMILAFILLFCAFFVYRKLKSGETSQMPWSIPYQVLKFVDIDACSLTSVRNDLCQETDSKLNDLFRSREFAMTDFGAVIIEPYVLKEEPCFDNSDVALLHQMKQMVHDNINQFIGVCCNKRNEFYTIWNYCFRGTLADLVFLNPMTSGTDKLYKNNESGSGFHENFKRAFVRDIIRGLEFLHNSTIGYHGSLTPSQCLIDSRWILKLSGFGLSKLLQKWTIKGFIGVKDRIWLISNSDLHYYSPDMRRLLKQMSKGTVKFNTKQLQAADIYSFGIILYEIISHRKSITLDDNHYGIERANLDTSKIFCESIEALIPPYPIIPKNIEVHPDLLGLMKKCWSEIINQRPDAVLARKITDATLKISGSLVDQMIKNLEEYTNNLEDLVKERTRQLEEAQEHAERLLLELLPKSVADELKISRRVDPKNYKSATVMYSDIVGFTSLCSDSLPMEVVTLLSGVFQKFDLIISQHHCYKVETIGDAYMVTSGVPIVSRHDHVRDIASVAILMRDFLSEYEIPHRPGQRLYCRWGFNTGPVFAGVVGLNAPRYCVFGKTVTLASKMESSGLPDKIQITLKSYQLLSERYPEFKCSPRGGVRIDGIGTLLTYWLDNCEELLKSSRSTIVENNDD
ncbi:unnamed protein product [Cercopithifilaria johnstoni]|uniref:Guanylate cyclase n=1 Tax=Cercopithifilaria johnstoni TaxID=2874296 RepID=A0A8J2PQT3_9BILA|nr:unnamed protein product [Cercopithifilaria johnstoni]